MCFRWKSLPEIKALPPETREEAWSRASGAPISFRDIPYITMIFTLIGVFACWVADFTETHRGWVGGAIQFAIMLLTVAAVRLIANYRARHYLRKFVEREHVA